ncbi:MAG: hypothetical protein MJA32_11255 [Proteobacteria bacterium]|nr:hypothetical protein [Pseudomonadota bacterium]
MESRSNSRFPSRGLAAWCLFPAAALAAFVCTARADEAGESNVEELFLSDMAYTQEQGEIQLTLELGRLDEADGRRTDAAVELEYGLSDAVQLSIGAPYTVYDDALGPTRRFGDLEAGLAVRLLRTGRHALTAALEVGYPAWDNGPDTDDSLEWEPSLHYSVSLDGVQLHAGLGAEIESGETEFSYHMAAVLPGDSVSAVVESSIADDAVFLVPGLVIHTFGDGQYNIGVPLGLGTSSGDWGLLMKAVWEW